MTLTSHSKVSCSTADRSLVPIGVTIGLGVFAVILGLAGHGFHLLAGEPLNQVVWHALKTVLIFVVSIPVLVCVGAALMNRFGKTAIQMRNAWTLGWLLSCVAMLSMMGVYS